MATAPVAIAGGAGKRPYRVIQWGTGMVGRHALRAIAERADLELVGTFVYSPAKVGTDPALIYGGEPTSIRCVSTLEEVLAIDADCVNYNALSTSFDNQYAALDDLCALLEAGFNVTGSAPEFLIYPPLNPPEVLERVERACAKGKSSIFISGINPGYMFDVLPITLSRVCRKIDRLYCAEICSMTEMASAAHVDALGFGLPPDVVPPFEHVIGGDRLYTNPYATAFRLLAETLHFDIERIELRTDRAVSDRPIEMAIRTFEPGTVTVRKFSFVGWSQGREVIELEFVWRMDPDVRPDWPTGDRYVVDIKGDPSMQVEVRAQTEYDTKRPISLWGAMAGVNAIPLVCDSEPGLKNVLHLPMWGARMATSQA